MITIITVLFTTFYLFVINGTTIEKCIKFLALNIIPLFKNIMEITKNIKFKKEKVTPSHKLTIS